MISESDIQFDKTHIWHPYTSTTNPLPVFPVASADGVYLTLEDGTKLIDGMSSWWSVIHGYNHHLLNEALTEQSQKMSHVMFGGLTHSPAIVLSKKLIAMSPKELNKVFLADSGSVAVEVAMKMAIQFWHGQERPQKSRFMALRGGYHGDTTGAMSLCDPVTGMHSLFKGIIPEHIFLPKPTVPFGEKVPAEIATELEELFQAHHHETAALFIEPIVQGAGGMNIYSAELLKLYRSLCEKYEILLVADEIATGFGRTGELFACEHAHITPDILCVGKALTGGYMTLAATLCSDAVADAVCSNDNVMMHGPTFMGNPLACAVANASLSLLQEGNWHASVLAIESQLKESLSSFEITAGVSEVRILGAIAVVELEKPVTMSIIQQLFVDHNIWVRPFGKLVYLMPPFTISKDELETLLSAYKTVITTYLENHA